MLVGRSGDFTTPMMCGAEKSRPAIIAPVRPIEAARLPGCTPGRW
jgi:hypothetical protein